VDDDDPWFKIPAADYEAHMSEVGQTAVLRELFARVYADVRPARLAILGCTTGRDFDQVDAYATELAVGVDLNPEYLEAARARLAAFGDRLRLVCADVTRAVLPGAPFDLVHAALLLEYVDPGVLLQRAHEWLAPTGTLSVVTQEPAVGLAAVSDTAHASLRALAARMTLRTAGEVELLADQAGFTLKSRRTMRLASGKSLVGSLFNKESDS
jgi:SAM-dependent methyltransferase